MHNAPPADGPSLRWLALPRGARGVEPASFLDGEPSCRAYRSASSWASKATTVSLALPWLTSRARMVCTPSTAAEPTPNSNTYTCKHMRSRSRRNRHTHRNRRRCLLQKRGGGSQSRWLRCARHADTGPCPACSAAGAAGASAAQAVCRTQTGQGLHLVQVMYVRHDWRLQLPAAVPVGQV